ncbi:MAG: hypothetical protein AAB584_00970, partial [Patescibacteria group bacterium]
KLEIVIRAAPPPFWIFAGLRLAEVASATPRRRGTSSPRACRGAKAVRTNSRILHQDKKTESSRFF